MSTRSSQVELTAALEILKSEAKICLNKYYLQHNPELLSNVDRLLAKNKGSLDALLDKVGEKYGLKVTRTEVHSPSNLSP